MQLSATQPKKGREVNGCDSDLVQKEVSVLKSRWTGHDWTNLLLTFVDHIINIYQYIIIWIYYDILILTIKDIRVLITLQRGIFDTRLEHPRGQTAG